MPDPELTNCANEVIERLFALDDAVANARAFRALLEDLHARDLSVVKEPHITAICGADHHLTQKDLAALPLGAV